MRSIGGGRLAIDRPLTDKEMAELRALSTRVHITPVSFTNEYHWGDFKGDPAMLMRRYFDAHVYVANWGSSRLMLRLPKEALDAEVVSAHRAGHALSIEAADAHWIIDC